MAKTLIKDKAVMMEEIRTLISEGRTVSLTVKGNSMNPFMVHLRDQITLGPWKDEDIRKGTVALVKDNRGNYLIHRIIKRDEDSVTLLGDGNIAMTETANLENIIGIMYSITRKGRSYSSQSATWRFYSWLWDILTPLRRWPLGLWRKLNRNKVFDFSKPAAAIIALMTLLAGVQSCEILDLNTPGYEDSETEQTPSENLTKEFVILFTNDLHSQIEPTSADETYNADMGGVKRLKALVDSVRTTEKAVLLADAGDLVQGTYYFSLMNGVVEMKVMNELGYDIRTLGNHEFDKKMVGLGDMFSWSSVPVVATNYDFANTSLSRFVAPSRMIQTGNVKVGFIGLNVRLQNLVDPTSCEGVVWQDAINVADQEAKKLRDQGADMVIALSHLGYDSQSDIYYKDRGIAKQTRHIDMIIGGHSHTFINKPDYVTNLDGDKVPIVQTGSRGICLGYSKIKLDAKGKPSFTYRLIPVTSRLDNRLDDDFSDLIDAYSATVKEKMNEVIAYCPYAIRKGNPESPLGNLSADALIWMAKDRYNVDADVSIYNSGGIRAEISQGDLTIGDVYAVYPFDNCLSILEVKGKDLMTLFNDVASNNGLPINSDVRLVISNKKVKSVTVKGEPVDYDKTYKVATIDYLVNTGRYGLTNALSRFDAPEYIRDYFVDYFRHLASQDPNGNIRAYTDGRVTID